MTTSAFALSCAGSSERTKSSRNLFAPVLMASLLAVGLLGVAPAAGADSGGHSLKAGRIAGNNAICTKRRFKRRFRSVKVHLPVGPTSVYYDYPYYYSRGHYPTHIGGYVYYPYHLNRRYHPRYVGRGSLRRHRSHGN
jgi:hypothetical protein